MAKGKTAAKGSTAVAAVNEGLSGQITIGNRVITVTKRVTVPTIKHKEGQSVGFTVLGKMFTGKAIGKDREPPTVVNVKELTTGREMQYIVPAILRSRWEDEYDGGEGGKHTYVGKNFAVYKGALGELSANGRRSRQVEVVEFEDNGEVAA